MNKKALVEIAIARGALTLEGMVTGDAVGQCFYGRTPPPAVPSYKMATDPALRVFEHGRYSWEVLNGGSDPTIVGYPIIQIAPIPSQAELEAMWALRDRNRALYGV